MNVEYSYIATGIGSFPHRGEREVFKLVFESFPEAPFWPQLPKRSFLEGMVVQYAQGFPSLKWDENGRKVWVDTKDQDFDKEVEGFYEWLEKGELEPFKITDDFALGLRILRELTSEEHRSKIKYIKGQITGPVTFGLALTDQDGKPIFYDPTLRDILVKHLSSKARWMERKFNELFPGIPTMIYFDEPSLSTFGSAFSGLNREEVVHALNECFEGVKGLKGTHCCGNTDWGVLLGTHLDILSFDAYAYLVPLSLYSKELKPFLERGGLLAWGIVPASEDALSESARTLVERLGKGMADLSNKGIDKTLLEKAIITPSCGTASLSVPLAEKVCQLTAEVSKRLRENQ